MEIGESQIGGVCVLHPRGRIDSTTAPAFHARLLQVVGEAIGGVVVDFAGIDYISSAGLRALMTATRQRKDHRLAVAGLSPILSEIFVIARFQHVIKILATVEDAVNSWGMPTSFESASKEAQTRES